MVGIAPYFREADLREELPEEGRRKKSAYGCRPDVRELSTSMPTANRKKKIGSQSIGYCDRGRAKASNVLAFKAGSVHL
jgi:hypothetical protein